MSGAIIPTSIASRGQGIQAQGLANLGKGIGDVESAVEQIAFAQGQSEASTAAVQASSVIKEMNSGLAKNNDPSTYADILKQTIDSLSDFTPKSGVGQKSYGDFLKRAIPQWESETKIRSIQTTHANIEADYITNWSTAVAQGDLTLADGLTATAEDSGVLTPQEAARQNVKSQTEVTKIRKAQFEGAVMSQAFDAWKLTVTPDNPDGDLNAALDLVDASGIPEEDKQEVESEIKTRVINRRGENQVALEKAQDEELANVNDLQYNQKNYSAATAAVLGSKVISEKDKRPILNEIETRARLAAKGGVEVDDPIAVDRASTLITQVGDDLIDIKVAKTELAKVQHLLKSTTAAQMWKDINEEFSKSTSTAYSRVRVDVRQRAIAKSESTLDLLIQALRGAKPKDEKGIEAKIVTAREKFNTELDRFNSWESSMRDWRRKNAEASPEAIQKEGIRSWQTEFSAKTPAELSPTLSASVGLFGTKVTATVDKKAKKEKPPVRMVNPDGKTGTIPAEQVKRAIELGWKKI